MSYILSCYTLFDITNTGVLNRNRAPADVEIETWLHKRNTQCNFDAILQAISLRSQPEIIRSPKKLEIRFDEFDHFGFLFEQQETETYPCWKFDFAVQHPSVFNDGISPLGALYNDCHNIPMVKCKTEWQKLPSFLDCTPELKNIHFEVNYE